MGFNVKKSGSFSGSEGMKVRGSGGRLFTSGEGPPTLVTSGLVLHLDATDPASYPGSGTTWYDLSPSGEDATLVGAGPTWNPAGYFTDFTDTNYVELQGNPYSVLPLGSSSRTIMAAVKTPDSLPVIWFGYPSPCGVFVYGGTAGAGGGCTLAVTWGNVLGNDVSSINSTSTNTVTANAFQVFGMRYDDAASPKHTFAIDGVIDPVTVNDNGMNTTNGGGDPQYRPKIGRGGVYGIPWIGNGRIYVILIYDRALSDAEMTQVSAYLATKMG
jgi:hypothetical protein